MSGFLHGAGATAPTDSMIAPLRPATWRIGSFDRYARASAAGARVVLVLSDLWGYQRPGAVRWPYDNYATWERFVDSVATVHAGKSVVWDVWNEPDIDFFWPQSDSAQARFHETYRRAARVLRARLGPDAMISGPSYSRYDRRRTVDFLNFCQANGCEVNALSWHELDPAETLDIAAHLTDARQSFVASGAYPALRLSELHVNETVGELDTHRPAAAVTALAQLEQGGADAAARACWNDSSGQSTCFNDSLDGLLTSSGSRRRASWWVYKAYADGMRARVASTSSDARLATLASVPNGTSAQVLLGSWSPDGAPANTATTVTVTRLSAVPALAARKTVRVRVWRVPNSGESAVRSLPLVSDATYAVSGDAVAVQLAMAMYEAAIITVE